MKSKKLGYFCTNKTENPIVILEEYYSLIKGSLAGADLKKSVSSAIREFEDLQEEGHYGPKSKCRIWCLKLEVAEEEV